MRCFSRLTQWLTKNVQTVTQACLVLSLALISVAYIRLFDPGALQSAFSPPFLHW